MSILFKLHYVHKKKKKKKEQSYREWKITFTLISHNLPEFSIETSSINAVFAQITVKS